MEIKESRVGKVFRIDGELYICLEDNGDRGLFQYITDMPIKPTHVYKFTPDMVIIEVK